MERRLGWGIVACAVSALGYSLLGLFGRTSFATGASLPTVVGWRFLIATGVLGLVLLATRRPLGRGRALWQPLLMGAVVYAAQNSLYFVALQRIPAGLTALLLYTMPVMVVVVEVARGTLKVRPATVLAVLLAVGGIGLTLVGPVGTLSLLGVLAAVGSAVVYTIYYLAMDSLPARTDWLASSFLVCVGVSITQVVLGTATGVFDPTPSPALLAGVVPMALCCTVLALTLLMTGVRLAGPTVAAVVSCLEPAGSVVIGAALLADPFGWPQAVGATSVVAAVVVLSLSRPRSGDVVVPDSPVVHEPTEDPGVQGRRGAQ